ncbi:hypothetical protein ACQP3C_30495, partial [Escherichia coli]
MKANSSQWPEIRVEVDEIETKTTISKSTNLVTGSFRFPPLLYSTSFQLETEANHEGHFTLSSILQKN